MVCVSMWHRGFRFSVHTLQELNTMQLHTCFSFPTNWFKNVLLHSEQNSLLAKGSEISLFHTYLSKSHKITTIFLICQQCILKWTDYLPQVPRQQWNLSSCVSSLVNDYRRRFGAILLWFFPPAQTTPCSSHSGPQLIPSKQQLVVD